MRAVLRGDQIVLTSFGHDIYLTDEQALRVRDGLTRLLEIKPSQRVDVVACEKDLLRCLQKVADASGVKGKARGVFFELISMGYSGIQWRDEPQQQARTLLFNCGQNREALGPQGIEAVIRFLRHVSGASSWQAFQAWLYTDTPRAELVALMDAIMQKSLLMAEPVWKTLDGGAE